MAGGGGTVTLRAVHRGKCLDVTGASTANGAYLSQYPCGDSDNQKFTVTPTGTAGVYTMKAQHSGRCVDVEGASAADGARMLQWDCRSGPNQQWRFTQS